MATLWDAVQTDNELFVQVVPFYAWLDEALMPFRPSMSVLCPTCGRKTSADAVLDTRAVTDTIVSPLGHSKRVDADWLCDGGASALVRDKRNGWTESRLLRAVGFPRDVVLEVRAKEIARAKVQRDGGNMHEEYTKAFAELPTTGEVPGTEHPGPSNEERKR